jgi:hypothetical protein
VESVLASISCVVSYIAPAGTGVRPFDKRSAILRGEPKAGGVLSIFNSVVIKLLECTMHRGIGTGAAIEQR